MQKTSIFLGGPTAAPDVLTWQLAFKHKRFQRRLADKLYRASCKPGGPQQIPRAISRRLQEKNGFFQSPNANFDIQLILEAIAQKKCSA